MKQCRQHLSGLDRERFTGGDQQLSGFFHTTAITTLNQTGRAIGIFLLLMGVYLLFSLITSLILNIYNRHVQLVER